MQRAKEPAEVLDNIPGLVVVLTADGTLEFINRRVQEYFGLSLEQLKGWITSDAIHPDDLSPTISTLRNAIKTGQPYQLDHRLLGRDGAYRWFHDDGIPICDADGRIVNWYVLFTDIHDRKTADEKLRLGARELESILDNIPGFVGVLSADGKLVFINRQGREQFGRTLEQLQDWAVVDSTHPDDVSRVVSTLGTGIQAGRRFESDHRLRGIEGDSYRWFHHEYVPINDANGRIANWYILATDIHQRKIAEEMLRQGARELASIIDTIPGLVMTATPEGEVEFVNKGTLEYFGKTLEEIKRWFVNDSIHPDDLIYAVPEWRRCVESGEHFDLDHRCRRADGEYRWFHSSALPMRDADGHLTRWYVLLTDINERKAAEQELRRSEESLLEAQKLSHTGSWKYVLSGAITITPEMGRIFGIDSGDHTSGTEFFFKVFHPEDRQRVEDLFRQSVTEKTDFQADYRIIRPDREIRHLHTVGHPIVNERSDLVEFVGTTVDVTETREARAKLERALEEIQRLKDRLQDENIALREEIIRSSMFEEIVGSSQPLRKVLEQVARVAPTDSTVLILGETGTGKELIARAIHKRSNRSSRAFISVNCGAIPQSLIASELFGYEKGAFTGAMQRRIGRFEAANGGTIFLDEVGELPMETQVALLRVLQEREFERIGGSERLQVDVRVLAATNRDLRGAVSSGAFRADLFYRLNVFPIKMPPLRERADDIAMLVQYLVDRYGKRIGKKFADISMKTLQVFQNYDWPGNIRELQNVVERAVIVCDGPSFSIDETWLKTELSPAATAVSPLSATASDGEKELIERALAQCRGRVSGTFGAAAKLGIPRQTLESKILRLGINKHQFRN
ncbi:MAG: sigma 54-interacting transcriptional regulator [Deltaproteobacteria bacterium]|nr:sigma 54-interacting transcriptional regulator [Deltaproteobacteria bacterium]